MAEINNYTRLDNYRYERKFRPEILSKQQVSNIVLSSAAFFRKIYHPRYINNIYLDTPELDSFFDNVAGKSDRRKYRIRWYGKPSGEITGAIFEIKIKDSYRGKKLSYLLPDFTLDESFNNVSCFKLLRSANMPLEIFDEVSGMEMKLLNRYSRQYFKDLSGNFRLTIDSDIQYFKLQDNFNRFVETFSDSEVIVEVKYDESFNENGAAGVINSMPFRLTRNSKYVDGIEAFYEVSL